jgi:hypothetical protein
MKGLGAICKRYKLRGLTDGELAVLAYNGLKADHVYLRLVKRYAIEKPWTRKSEDINK